MTGRRMKRAVKLTGTSRRGLVAFAPGGGGRGRLLRDRDLAVRLGAQGRSLVERRFSLKTQLDSTIAVYRELFEVTNRRHKLPVASVCQA